MSVDLFLNLTYACFQEGPMAHSGGIMAAGLGKGRIPWFSRDIKVRGLMQCLTHHSQHAAWCLYCENHP